MIVRPAIDNVAITKENMISSHHDRIVDRDGHARYSNTMLDYLFPVLYLRMLVQNFITSLQHHVSKWPFYVLHSEIQVSFFRKVYTFTKINQSSPFWILVLKKLSGSC